LPSLLDLRSALSHFWLELVVCARKIQDRVQLQHKEVFTSPQDSFS